jgi:hydroxymethylpyrimidine pyrophosphatase-like HAD family hydrolase
MSKSKKGLSSKVITVFDPNTDEEFEVYVTYEWYNESDFSEEFSEESTFNRENIDIKHFEPNNDEDMPSWVVEDLVYDSLIDELEIEFNDEELIVDDIVEDDYDDYYKDEDINESNENW